MGTTLQECFGEALKSPVTARAAVVITIDILTCCIVVPFLSRCLLRINIKSFAMI